jgi:hypothetical protein
VVELSCADAGEGNEPSPLDLGGLTFEGLGNRPAAYPVSEAGVRVPAGDPGYFTKVPVYLQAGAMPVTIRLTTPGSYLAWVPAGAWASGPGGPPNLGPWLATTVTFDGCPDSPATYFGGLVVPGPQVCLSLAITRHGASAPPSQRHVGPPGC